MILILYLDTGALVKLFIDEDGSATVEALVQQASIVATSLIAYAEGRAALRESGERAR